LKIGSICRQQLWTGAQASSLAFPQRLQALGKTYELIIYANDNHGVTMNREDADRRIVEWFKSYMK
jgi:dipeptidyl aminopeptidase/acylaminoacyl peptidase